MPTFRLPAILLAAALTATACGGSSAPTTSGSMIDITTPTVAVLPELLLTSELDTTQMFDTRTEDITSLSEVVTGDRAVLLWYWAPN